MSKLPSNPASKTTAKKTNTVKARKPLVASLVDQTRLRSKLRTANIKKNNSKKENSHERVKKAESHSGTSAVRLQKFLAECGVASRRASETLISEGRVKVNGKVITKLGTQIDPYKDTIIANGVHVKPARKEVLLFHKPRHVVSTMSDPEGRPCITDYLTKEHRNLFPVGRLDWESSGLIVLTNDGELGEILMHPRYEIERTYEVRVEGDFTGSSAVKLQKGVKLEDGKAYGESQFISNDGRSTWLKVIVREGRNRLVRRIMQELGHPVMKLRRISHGPFSLKGMQPGEIRKLPEKEYKAIRDKVFKTR